MTGLTKFVRASKSPESNKKKTQSRDRGIPEDILATLKNIFINLGEKTVKTNVLQTFQSVQQFYRQEKNKKILDNRKL